MPWMRCKCKYAIELRSFPNKHTYHFCSEKNYYKVFDMIGHLVDRFLSASEKMKKGRRDAQYLNDSVAKKRRKMRSFFQECILCPNCGRLIMYSKNGKHVKVYQFEEEVDLELGLGQTSFSH